MRIIEKICNKKLPFPISIAIDGPAASGKSTTAKAIAEKLGLTYIDTGAMYRAFTLKLLKNKISLSDTFKISTVLEKTTINLEYKEKQLTVLLDGKDVSDEIRTLYVSSSVSEVSAIAAVRDQMTGWQRKIAAEHDAILDGRDIGTVVLPNAHLKIYMVCSATARAERRLEELLAKGEKANITQIIHDIEKRDQIDSNRQIAPLRKADDAIEIDTSRRSIPEQTKLVIDHFIQKMEEL